MPKEHKCSISPSREDNSPIKWSNRGMSSTKLCTQLARSFKLQSTKPIECNARSKPLFVLLLYEFNMYYLIFLTLLHLNPIVCIIFLNQKGCLIPLNVHLDMNYINHNLEIIRSFRDMIIRKWKSHFVFQGQAVCVIYGNDSSQPFVRNDAQKHLHRDGWQLMLSAHHIIKRLRNTYQPPLCLFVHLTATLIKA